MAITQDGTHRFAIPNSPLNINSVTYIAEDLEYALPADRVGIYDDEGTPLGGVIIDKEKTLSGTLQLATSSTAIPTRGQTFAFENSNYYLVTVSRSESQQQYAKVSFTAVEKIN